MVPTAVLELVQVTVTGKGSLYWSKPDAVNCWVSPTPTVGVAGDTVILVRTGAAWGTVTSVVPLTNPSVAVIVVVPEVSAMKRPPEVMVPTAVLELVQVTVTGEGIVILVETGRGELLGFTETDRGGGRGYRDTRKYWNRIIAVDNNFTDVLYRKACCRWILIRRVRS